jgi:hypothetical protein
MSTTLFARGDLAVSAFTLKQLRIYTILRISSQVLNLAEAKMILAPCAKRFLARRQFLSFGNSTFSPGEEKNEASHGFRAYAYAVGIGSAGPAKHTYR